MSQPAPDVKGEIVRILARLEASATWVICPFCDEEWTRLKTCDYYRDGKPAESSVCVECAESVKGLPTLSHVFPIPGAKIHVNETAISRKYGFVRDMTATVFYGAQSFLVRTRGGWLEVQFGPEETKRYPNTYQTWLAIKARIEGGENSSVEEAESWGSAKKKAKRSEQLGLV